MNKIKLCAISTVSNTINAFMLESLIDLSNKGFEITIISDMQDGFIEKVPSAIKCIDLKMERKADIKGGLKATYKMYRIFKTEKFDIVQYATPNASFYASIAAFSAKIPKRLYLQWGIRYVGFKGMKRLFYKNIERTICLLSTNIRPDSKKNLQFAVDEKLYRKQKAKLIGDGGTLGVDLKNYKQFATNEHIKRMREKLNFKNKFVFGFVGSIRKDKGVNELLQAFKKVVLEYPNTHLLILGKEFPGDPINTHLKKWAINSDKITFAGYVSNVPKYLSAIDVLVHPSYREGFSMVIQEAQALNKAVITTDIPGPSEVIDVNKTGVLVQSRDSEDLSKKMQLFLEQPELAHRMGKLGRKRVEALFTRERMLRLTYEDRLNLYKEERS